MRAAARVAYLLGALSRSDGRLSNTSNLQALRKRPSGSLFQPSPVKPIRQGMAWHYKEYQHEQTTQNNGPGVLSVIAGQTQVMFANTPGVDELAKAGRVRILAVTTTEPSPVFPGVPWIAAAGVPGYEALTIDAVVVPARTPAAIVNRLNQEIVRALNELNTKKTLSSWSSAARRRSWMRLSSPRSPSGAR